MNHREIKRSESLRTSTVATNVASRTSDKVLPCVRVAAVRRGGSGDIRRQFRKPLRCAVVEESL